MPFHKEEFILPSIAPGVTHKLLSYSFGELSGGKSAYIQAGLHGDEHPGLLVIQHLLEILTKLDEQGAILGRITLVPFANPLGMAQRLFGPVVGRFDFENGENFNRNFPNLAQAVTAEIQAGQGDKNTEEWKRFLLNQLELNSPKSAAAVMKLQLAKHSIQHDIVLDLHCDTESIAHIYTSRLQQERALALAEAMSVEVVFAENLDAGGGALDQTHSGAWGTLQQHGLMSADDAGFSATIELRGQADVSDALAQRDAAGIIHFLRQQGVVVATTSGNTLPRPRPPKIYPLEGASHISCPCAGIIVYRKTLGDTVKKGEIIGEVVKLDGTKPNERMPILSDIDGVLVVRQQQRLVRPGQRAALVAGEHVLNSRVSGKLLLDF